MPTLVTPGADAKGAADGAAVGFCVSRVVSRLGRARKSRDAVSPFGVGRSAMERRRHSPVWPSIDGCGQVSVVAARRIPEHAALMRAERWPRRGCVVRIVHAATSGSTSAVVGRVSNGP